MRGLDILRESGLTVKVVRLPDGLDPDEIVNGRGADAYRKLLGEALPLTEYKLVRLREKYDLSDRDDRTKYAAEAVRIVRAQQNPVEIEEYLKTIAAETGYDMSVLRRQAQIGGDEEPAREAPAEKEAPKEAAPDITDKTETYLLAALVAGKEYVDPEDYTEIFTDGIGELIVESVTDSRLKGLKDVSAMLYSDLPDEVQSLLPPIIDFDFGGYDDRKVYEACATKLRRERLERESDELARKYDESGDITLLTRCNELKQKLKKLRSTGGAK